MNTNPHEQHRERLRKMFLYCTAEKFPDHMLLELLLCYAIPRADTNPIAHELIRRFGSIENTLDADVEELTKVDGVGESAALLLKMIPLFCNRYASNKLKQRTDFHSIERAADFFKDYYISKNKEMVCALLLDNAHRLICHVELYEGAVNSSNVNTRKLAQIALSYNAAELILAHNHPSGDPTPSDADLYTTKHLMKAFSAIDLKLRAHLIIAGNRYVDVVQTVYDNAKYEVKYMAFRADDLPTVFLDEDDLPLPANIDSPAEGSPASLAQQAKTPSIKASDRLPQDERKSGKRAPAAGQKFRQGAAQDCALPTMQADRTTPADSSKQQSDAEQSEQLTIPEAIRLLEQNNTAN